MPGADEAVVTAADVIAFWIGPAPDEFKSVTAFSKRWYRRDAAVDSEIRERFGDAIEAARRGRLTAWGATAEGALGLVILLDQFTRNAYRDTPEAFSGDDLAREVAGGAIDRGLDQELPIAGRALLYHPFEHAETAADQRRSVALFEALVAAATPEWREFATSFLNYARAHQEVIARFGRFPHRNASLGRESTPAELAYLEAGGGF